MSRKRTRRSFTVLLLSLFLIGVFLFGVVRIFGPVVAAEARYQMKSAARALGAEDGDWRRLIVPRFDFAAPPVGETSDYGIVIPKIFVSEKVVANVDPTDKAAYTPALEEGIAHAAGTGLPGDGQLGYYFAHSSESSLQASRLNAVFYLLGKLEPGDRVELWREQEKYVYQVKESLVTEPEDLSFLDPARETEMIALQTCWPVGTSLKRLIVLAERVTKEGGDTD